MRILFVADAGSIHTQRWLEHFRDQQHDVHVASFRSCKISGVKLHLLPTFGLGRLGYFFSLFFLPRIFKKIKPDLVHAHHLTSYGFLSALTCIGPLIVTAWGSDALVAPRKSCLLRFFASYAVRHADIVTTLAEHMNQAVFDLGANPKRVLVTPFGVDTDFFIPINSEKGDSKNLRLICTRLFDDIYDVATLVTALGKVTEKNYKVSVDLVGDGPLALELKKMVSDLNLESSVTFHGFVKRGVLASLLANADVFVSPALSDGNNVSLNEAMACGCFIIATDIPANAQWVKNGSNGFLYPPGDTDQLAQAIQASLENSKLREYARLENRKIAQTLVDWRICTVQMQRAYQEALDARVKFEE